MKPFTEREKALAKKIHAWAIPKAAKLCANWKQGGFDVIDPTTKQGWYLVARWHLQEIKKLTTHFPKRGFEG